MDNLRRDEDQALHAFGPLARRLEEVSEHGDVHEDRYAAGIRGLLLVVVPADKQALPAPTMACVLIFVCLMGGTLLSLTGASLLSFWSSCTLTASLMEVWPRSLRMMCGVTRKTVPASTLNRSTA